MDRKDYSVRELINDTSFRRMVKGKATPEEIDYWDNWIEENDQNRLMAKSAISEIVGFEFKEPKLPDIQKEWVRLYAKTAGKKNIYIRERRNNEQQLKWVLRFAAVLLLSSMLGWGVYNLPGDNEGLTHLEQMTEERTIVTKDGEQKTLMFSNGSKVVMNSNSSLTYRLGLIQNQTIDVTLEGEAWFDVESNYSSGQPVFAVRTPDGIIRNIGTKFLVTVQQGQSRVVLQEGVVEVEPLQTNGDSFQGKKAVFRVEKTGEMVTFTRTEILKREVVNSTFYSSWATGFMEFDQTAIQEFANYIGQRFDVHVQMNDPDLKDIKIDGAVYFRSLEELLRSVSEVIGVPVYRSERRDMVYIGRSK